ncbi:MAG: hypothetical protein J7L03_03485 [Caldisericaceae bacterium]|nr:hypothetical protein [Caldisericaceae bacterium]
MIFFFYPSGRTIAMSLTGTYCELKCKHCNAQYLKGMLTKEQTLKAIESRPGYYKSVLVSGGSTKEGKVPVVQNLRFIKKLYKMGLKLNFHTGLLEREEILKIKPYASRISFDFIYDDEVIKNVYGLTEKTKEDYEKTYLLMRRLVGGRIENKEGYPSSRVVPHYTIGLNCGKITKGDFDTISELAYLKPTLLVIDVFIPTKGTPFENCPPPPLEGVREILDKARRRLTRTTMFLGCMRPFGEYREKLDLMAYELGVKGFVKPSRPLIEKVKNSGEKIVIKEECCALI